MTERENLPVVIAAQAVAVLTEKPGSLVGRGLVAIRNNKLLVPAKNNDDLYHQARMVFDQMVFDQEEGWCEDVGRLNDGEKGNPALSSAFQTFQQLAEENYGKAFYPLSVFCGWRDITAHLEQDEVRLRRRPIGTLYLGQQIREFIKNRTKFPKYAQQAFGWCIANKSNEDAELWFDLGRMYERGHGVARDSVQAAIWYRKAGEQGHVRAQYMMASCYMEGSGITLDYTKAAEWYLKAANQGYLPAQIEIGMLYDTERGFMNDTRAAEHWVQEQDDAKAAQWYRMAAEQGDDYSQCLLGLMYREGRGVEQNHEQAVYWLRKVAEQGDYSDFAQKSLRELGIDWKNNAT